jgi:hypothetical protein
MQRIRCLKKNKQATYLLRCGNKQRLVFKGFRKSYP